MKKTDFSFLIKECLQEILEEGRRICAWCKKDLGYLDDNPGDSHGICDKCAEEQQKEIEKMFGKKSS
jgi:hypothetical protein